MSPRVAIITRTKDRPLFLRRAIKSVLAQEFTDWRHVIVNDGGDVESLKALLDGYRERYAGRLEVVHHATSRGMQEAANAGIAATESTFVCLHDDDDSWDPGFLTATVGRLEEEGTASRYQGVIAHTVQIEETVKGDRIIERSCKPYIPLPEISLFRLGYENPFPPIAFCYRRSAYEMVGPYDPRFTVAGDYDFNFRFLRRYEIAVVTKPLAYYHMRSSTGDSAHQNSIVAGAGEHKRRYNELKNHYLRGQDSSLDPALALGFNAAKYLVELEWLAHEINRRAEKIEGVSDATQSRVPTIEKQINRALELQDEAFRELIERAQDPRVLEQLASALRDLSFMNEVLDGLSRQTANLSKQSETVLRDLNKQSDTALRDLSYLNGCVDAFRQRTEELAKQEESQAEAILGEIRAHHKAVHEASREKTIFQIGSLRLSWKKKTKSRPAAEDA